MPEVVPPAPIRIVLADAVERVRVAVRALLELQTDMQVVGEAADGGSARSLVDLLRPDVLLLDCRLPDTDGLRLTADLHGARPDLGLVLYAVNPLSGTPEAALRAGAACFLEKGASPLVLLQALRQAAGAGIRPLHPLSPQGELA